MQIKLTFALMLAVMLNAYAGGFAQNITLDVDNAPIEKVFKRIESQAGVTFIAKADLLDRANRVTLHVKNASLDEILEKCFRNQPFTYSKVGSIITLKNKAGQDEAGAVFPLMADEPPVVNITGRVTDETGQPLAGVTVTVKDSKTGTASNSNGEYALHNIDEKAILVFSIIGYTPQSIPVNGRSSIYIILQREVKQQNEIVVVGYGTVKRKDLTGAVSSVSGEELIKTPNALFDAALVGRAPGVQVVKSSGAPGAVASIRIRGGTSAIGTNEPLYVVDGVPIEMGDGFGNEAFQNDSRFKMPALANFNVADIESIDILKDASSAAIYGSRAANGVVIITTKRGKKGDQPAINFGYTSSFDKFANYNYSMLNAAQYHDVVATAYENAGMPVPTNHIAYPDANTNWVDLTTRTAPSNNVNLSVSGGSKDGNTLYLLSGSLTNQEGVIRFTDFERKNLRANIETSLFGKLKFGTNILYSSTRNQGSGRAFFYNIVSYRPDVPLYDSKGNYGAAPDSVNSNPYARIKQLNEVKNEGILTSFFAELTLWNHLKMRSTININNNKGSNVVYTPSTDIFEIRNGRKGTRNDNIYSSSSSIFDNTITYDRRFNKHGVNVLVGASYTRVQNEFTTLESTNFQDDEVLNNLGSAGTISSYSSGGGISGLSSYFVQGNYNYAGKYFVTFTGRADHSTKFGPENRWGYFPSGAIAWKLMKEKFMQNVRAFDDIKVRLSYGKTGSANFTDFQYATFFGSGSFYNNNNGVIANTIPNPDIKWESTYQFDAAIDFGLLNNKLYGSIGYFEKTTRDMILNRQIIRETGGMNQFANMGDFLNRGWEFQLGSDLVSRKNFAYTTDINITRYRSKVLKLNEGSYLNLREGEPIGYFSGYRVAGIFQGQKEIDDLNANSPSGYYQSVKTAPGDFKFVDVNNDGIINSEDNVVLGKAEPDFYGGWNNIIRYKKFEFSAFFTFSIGNSLSNVARRNMLIFATNTNNYSSDLLNAWSAGKQSASLPRIAANDPNNNRRDSDFFIEDASYFKVKNLQLSYVFGHEFLRKYYIKTVRAFATVTNLYTFTKYSGLDPEVNAAPTNNFSQGIDNNIYPQTRTISVGINVNF